MSPADENRMVMLRVVGEVELWEASGHSLLARRCSRVRETGLCLGTFPRARR
jgi:hypothetical protein